MIVWRYTVGYLIDNRIDSLKRWVNVRRFILFCFVSLKLIILDSVGHKPRVIPLDGVAENNKLLIFKGRPTYIHISDALQLLMNFVPIKSIEQFCFGWDFPAAERLAVLDT